MDEIFENKEYFKGNSLDSRVFDLRKYLYRIYSSYALKNNMRAWDILFVEFGHYEVFKNINNVTYICDTIYKMHMLELSTYRYIMSYIFMFADFSTDWQRLRKNYMDHESVLSENTEKCEFGADDEYIFRIIFRERYIEEGLKGYRFDESKKEKMLGIASSGKRTVRYVEPLKADDEGRKRSKFKVETKAKVLGIVLLIIIVGAFSYLLVPVIFETTSGNEEEGDMSFIEELLDYNTKQRIKENMGYSDEKIDENSATWGSDW